MQPWLIHFSQLADDFKIMGHWLIHFLQLADNFKIIGPWLIHFSQLAEDFKIIGTMPKVRQVLESIFSATNSMYHRQFDSTPLKWLALNCF